MSFIPQRPFWDKDGMFGAAVSTDIPPEYQGKTYHDAILLLIKEVESLKKRIEELENRYMEEQLEIRDK